MQIATQRGMESPSSTKRKRRTSTRSLLELKTDAGSTEVEGAVVLGRPRLIRVDGIYCEAPLSGHLIFMKNQDVPGVIGHVGTVLGKNGINIANFSLGRRDAPLHPGEPLEALAIVETDTAVPETVLAQLRAEPGREDRPGGGLQLRKLFTAESAEKTALARSEMCGPYASRPASSGIVTNSTS